MKIEKKDLEKGKVELTIEIPKEEIKTHLENAAKKISKNKKLPGFRPGKAPYELVKSNVGEMAIYQEALNDIITDTYYKAVTREKLQAIGQPEINVEKVAPDNPIVYKAIVSLLPKVTLGDWQSVSVKKKDIKVEKEEIDKTIKQLTEMNVKETIEKKKAEKGDKAEINFEVLINKAVIEGGKNDKYPIVLGESKMIPGFEEEIIGLKAGDKKEFELKFPKEYFQKNLADKLATFKVEVLNVFKRDLPKIDDSFAQTIGFDTLDKLKKQLADNILKEKEEKEKQRIEKEAIEEIVKVSKIDDIPDTLIKNETHKMIHELEYSIQRQGMDMAGYLKSIKKTKEDLEKDFEGQAIERVKAALIMKQLGEEEKIKVEDKEIDEDIKKQEEMYKDNKEVLKNIKLPAFRNHVANMLINQKIIKLISDKVIK